MVEVKYRHPAYAQSLARPFKCSVCSKGYVSQRGLDRHTKEAHTSEGNFLDAVSLVKQEQIVDTGFLEPVEQDEGMEEPTVEFTVVQAEEEGLNDDELMILS